MQVKTLGIVLHTTKYSDSSTIINVYTQQFGRAAYMVYGVNKKKSVVRSAFLHPLSIVEMDVSHIPGKNIQQIKDIRMKYTFTGIPFDPVKNSLALFLSEMLFRILRQTEPDNPLFLYLENSIQHLDCCEDGIANFHLIFLIKLTRYLGFEPNNEDVQTHYFDLMNGVFLNDKPQHPHFLSREITAKFNEVLNADFSTMHQIILERKIRLKLLEGIIDYYRLHIPGFLGVHSLEILQSIFD